MKKTNEITLQKNSKIKSLPSKKQFQAWVDSALAGQKKKHELVIRIVDEKEITHLNKTYRKKNKPTNILSFPFETPHCVKTNFLGDLVISAPTIRKEAKQQKKTFVSHWAHLTIHGTLHLLGHSHEKEKDAKKMEKLETKIMKELGFPDPY